MSPVLPTELQEKVASFSLQSTTVTAEDFDDICEQLAGLTPPVSADDIFPPEVLEIVDCVLKVRCKGRRNELGLLNQVGKMIGLAGRLDVTAWRCLTSQC